MKIVKASNGKNTIKMSKSEWINIGRKAGWMRTASQLATIVQGISKGVSNPNDTASLQSLLNSAGQLMATKQLDPADMEAIKTLSGMNPAQTQDQALIQAIQTAKQLSQRLQSATNVPQTSYQNPNANVNSMPSYQNPNAQTQQQPS